LFFGEFFFVVGLFIIVFVVEVVEVFGVEGGAGLGEGARFFGWGKEKGDSRSALGMTTRKARAKAWCRGGLLPTRPLGPTWFIQWLDELIRRRNANPIPKMGIPQK
jgi:hypothetical protein